MTLTHESGHILGGWLCGATLHSADLLPWHLPYSIFDPDPQPLITLWGGPILGVLIPLATALIIRQDWSWFIAHFCILANGVYLATSWFLGDRYLDTPKLLDHGARPATIVIYCILTIGFGYVGFRRECIRLLASPTRIPGIPNSDPNINSRRHVAEQSDERER